MLAKFFVHGKPVPQGSVVAHVRGGKASIHYASGSGLAVWRNMVSAAAREAWKGDVYGGSINLLIEFHMKRPRSHYRNLSGDIRPAAMDELPIVSPDLDKLIRAILDSLTGIVYRDDAQVVSIFACKLYRDHPGVEIGIY